MNPWKVTADRLKVTADRLSVTADRLKVTADRLKVTADRLNLVLISRMQFLYTELLSVISNFSKEH